MEIKQVKEDLKELKKTVHLIDTLIRTKNAYAYRIKELNEMGKGEKASELIEMIEQMQIENHLREAIELQNKYSEAIATLGIVDKTIVLEYYVNGLTAWKIGSKLGYSEEAIRKHLAKALAQIAKAI